MERRDVLKTVAATVAGAFSASADCMKYLLGNGDKEMAACLKECKKVAA